MIYSTFSQLNALFYSILIGFFAGWTNENSGGAMILLIMLFLLYYKFQYHK